MTKTEKKQSKKSKAVILFIRRPQLGKVKTRIAATEGDEKALNIYKILLQHTHYVVSRAEADLLVFYADQIEEDDIWSQIATSKYLQSPGNLGKRMKAAFELAFQSYEQLVIIGSDCAQLRAKQIRDAFAALEEKKIVIGPCKDGGYYLLGASELYPELFENIPWSTDKVSSKTIAAAKAKDLSIHKLKTLADIDSIEDWEEYGWPYIQEYEKLI